MKNLEKEMEKFAELVIGKLRTLYPNLEFRYQDVRKNNGLILHGIILKDDKQIAPNIYLDDAFSEYKNGRSLDMIVSHISEIYEQSRKIEMVIDFTDYEKVKKLIRFKLVNTERNAEYLTSIPHDDFLDLSKVYYLRLDDSKDGMATTVITNELLTIWKKEKEKIALQAAENVRKEISFISMEEVLREAVDIEMMGAYTGCDRIIWEKADEKIIISGSKAWEMDQTNSVFANASQEALKSYIFCFNFTQAQDYDAIREGMRQLKRENVHFLKYLEDPFSNYDFSDGDEIFANYLPDDEEPEETKKSFFKRMRKNGQNQKKQKDTV